MSVFKNRHACVLYWRHGRETLIMDTKARTQRQSLQHSQRRELRAHARQGCSKGRQPETLITNTNSRTTTPKPAAPVNTMSCEHTFRRSSILEVTGRVWGHKRTQANKQKKLSCSMRQGAGAGQGGSKNAYWKARVKELTTCKSRAT